MGNYFIILYILLLLVARDMPLIMGFSVSTILMPFMFFHLMTKNNKAHNKSIRNVSKLYVLFIVWFIFAGLVNGDFIHFSGSISLLINYVNCILIGNLIVVTINDKIILDRLFNLLLCVIVFNILITLAQFLNYELGWTIWNLLNPNINDIIEENMLEATQGGEQILGFNFCPGLFQSAVTNGYFMASFGLLPLVLASRKIFFIKRFIIYSIYICSLITLLIIQQRAAFFIFIILSIVILYKTRKSQKAFISIIALATIIIIPIASDIISELGRISEMSLAEDSRMTLFSQAIDYISSNLLFGGRAEFLDRTDKNAHNFILNAFIYSGLIGAILLLTLAGKMMIDSARIIISRNNSGSSQLFCSCALISYISIGLVHNESLVTGTPVIFILYGMLIVSLRIADESK